MFEDPCGEKSVCIKGILKEKASGGSISSRSHQASIMLQDSQKMSEGALLGKEDQKLSLSEANTWCI